MSTKLMPKSIQQKYTIVVSISIAVLSLIICLILYNKHSTFGMNKGVSSSITAPSLIPTPSPDLNRKVINTFYIHATSNKSNQELVLTPSDTGKTFKVSIGTLIILEHFAKNYSHITYSSQNIFEGAGSKSNPIHLPLNSSGAYIVVSQGSGTIMIVENSPK